MKIQVKKKSLQLLILLLPVLLFFCKAEEPLLEAAQNHIQINGRPGEISAQMPDADRWYVNKPEVRVYAGKYDKVWYQWNNGEKVNVEGSVLLPDELLPDGKHCLRIWVEEKREKENEQEYEESREPDIGGVAEKERVKEPVSGEGPENNREADIDRKESGESADNVEMVCVEACDIWIDTFEPQCSALVFRDAQGKEIFPAAGNRYISADEIFMEWTLETGISGLAGFNLQKVGGDRMLILGSDEAVLIRESGNRKWYQLRCPIEAGDYQNLSYEIFSMASQKGTGKQSGWRIIIDENPPEIGELRLEGEQGDELAWYLSAVTAAVEIEDPEAGLQKIIMEVNGMSGKDEHGIPAAMGAEYYFEREENPVKSRVFSFSIDPRELAGKREAVYRVQVTAWDWAGNRSTSEIQEVYIETEVPEIEVSAYVTGSVTNHKEQLYAGTDEEGMPVWTGGDIRYEICNKNVLVVSDLLLYVKQADEDWKFVQQGSADAQFSYLLSTRGDLAAACTFKLISVTRKEREYTDLAEWKYECEPLPVYIDKTPPALPVIRMEPAEADGWESWFRSLPEIELTQQGDGGSPITASVRLYNQFMEEINAYSFKASGHKDKGVQQMLIEQDGVYYFELSSQDAVGRKSEVLLEKIRVDTTKPEIAEIRTEYWQQPEDFRFLAGFTYPYLFRDTVKVTIAADDNLSGLSGSYYKLVADGMLFSMVPFQEGNSFLIPPDFKGTIHTYVVDKAGNSTAQDGILEEGNWKNIIVDKTEPEIELSSQVDYTQWQNDIITLQIAVKDELAGLDFITYEWNGSTHRINLQPFLYAHTFLLNLEEEAVTAEGINLTVQAVDHAGNGSEKQVPVFIDRTAPVLEIEAPLENSHHNEVQHIQVQVNEQIYTLAGAELMLRRILEGEVVENRSIPITLTGTQTVIPISLEAEGEYLISARAEDQAGNAGVSQEHHFVIDDTPPVIDLDGVREGYFYSQNLYLDVAVTEFYYEDVQVLIQIDRELDGAVSFLEVPQWNGEGKKTVQRVPLTEDGSYSVKVQAQDKAGNKAASRALTFFIDQEHPRLLIDGIEDFAVVSEPISLQLLVLEEYLDSEQVFFSLRQEDEQGGKKKTIRSLELDFEGQEEVWIEAEGIYLAELEAVDLAGNKSQYLKYFTLDATSPVIHGMEVMDGLYFRTFRMPVSPEEMVTDLTIPTISMYLDGRPYSFGIDVEEEGHHQLVLEAVDEAGLRSRAHADFIVDQTPPEIVVRGIKEGEVKTRNFVVAVNTEEDAKITSLILNGQELEVQENEAMLQIREEGEYQLLAVATDLAGNVQREEITFRLKRRETVAAGNYLPAVLLFILAVPTTGILIYKKMIRKRHFMV